MRTILLALLAWVSLVVMTMGPASPVAADGPTQKPAGPPTTAPATVPAIESAAPAYPTKMYFVDEEAIDQGKIEPLVRPVTDVAPLPNPNNQKLTIVEGVFMSWGDDKDMKLAWMKKWEPKAKALKERFNKGEQLNQMEQDQLMNDQGLWIRSPKPGSKWYRAMSQEADQIRQEGPPPRPANAPDDGLHNVAPK